MLDAQPAAVYPASPDDPSRKSKFGFWLEHHRIYFLTIVLSTNVAVGMKFDPTCRQRNLSSTTALVRWKYKTLLLCSIRAELFLVRTMYQLLSYMYMGYEITKNLIESETNYYQGYNICPHLYLTDVPLILTKNQLYFKNHHKKSKFGATK